MSETNNGVVSEHGKKIAEMVENIKGYGRAIKTGFLILACSVSSFFGVKMFEHHEAPAAVDQQQSIAAPLVSTVPSYSSSPAAIPSMTFTVLSVGQSKSGKKFLNSTANYRDAANQTVVLEGAAAAAFDVNSLKGKTITAFGKRSEYHGKPQVVVTDPGSIQAR